MDLSVSQIAINSFLKDMALPPPSENVKSEYYLCEKQTILFVAPTYSCVKINPIELKSLASQVHSQVVSVPSYIPVQFHTSYIRNQLIPTVTIRPPHS